MQDWNSFFVATTGASAALAGLIFVGVSLSLSEILKTKTLPSRAAVSIMLLSMILVNSIFGLIPGQSLTALGCEILACGVFMWILISRHDLIILKNIDRQFRIYQIGNICFDQSSTIFIIICGIMLIVNGAEGIYWIVPGFIIAFTKAISDGWVLLVEINR